MKPTSWIAVGNFLQGLAWYQFADAMHWTAPPLIATACFVGIVGLLIEGILGKRWWA